MTQAGYDSQSLATHATTNTTADLFDVRLDRDTPVPAGLNATAYCTRAALAFIHQLFRADAVHMFFSGGVLNQTPLRDWEPQLWKLAGVRIILMPYGSDAFVYRELPDTIWADELKRTYPRTSELDDQIANRILRFSKAADAVVGSIVHTATLPRVDAWPVLWYPAGSILAGKASGSRSDHVHIAHPTNHRAIKGTEFLISAVEALSAEGHDITLDIIEGVDMEASRKRLANADIVFDQLHMGYAMTAIEGMALGKPVLSGIGDDDLYAPFVSRSYLSECPIIRVTPETLTQELRKLIVDAKLRDDLGRRGADYVAHRHSDDASVDLFENVYAAIVARDVKGLQSLFST